MEKKIVGPVLRPGARRQQEKENREAERQGARQTSQSGFAMLQELGPRVSEEGQSLSTGGFGARAFAWPAAQGVTPQKQIATPFSNLL